MSLYTSQKFLNNTYYKSYKDLAFISRKTNHGTIKVFQDVVRPDLIGKLTKMDTREKLGFLQLQALVGISKLDSNDKNGNPLTIETDSHGVIKSTFEKLNKLGYLQNYEEAFLKKSRLILPKLAFANRDLSEKIDVYNMKFQKSDKEIDFEDLAFRKMFPMVFSQRGLLASKGYSIKRDEEGKVYIDYGKGNKEITKFKESEKRSFKDKLKVHFSQETQKDFTDKYMENIRTSQKENKEMEK